VKEGDGGGAGGLEFFFGTRITVSVVPAKKSASIRFWKSSMRSGRPSSRRRWTSQKWAKRASSPFCCLGTRMPRR